MDGRYQVQPAQPHRRKRRRRRNYNALLNILLLLIALIMLVGTVKAFMDGVSDNSGIDFTDKPSDTTPPVLAGVRDLTLYQGDTVSYLSGVTATDDTDSTPQITVDAAAVDLSSPGVYEVVYLASDASGNVNRATATVIVLEKKAGYVDLETIYAAADAKLAQIIRDNATVKQQVHDIYAWARLNLTYSGHSDRADWRQTAYTMLTDGTGDCFGYFAVTKLLFERLGILNIDVQKVRNSAGDSDHFWSLVSVNGGETYYHFDATPRAGDGDDFCLVTDAFLDAYSDTHKGSHNRDKSLYPATPET